MWQSAGCRNRNSTRCQSGRSTARSSRMRRTRTQRSSLFPGCCRLKCSRSCQPGHRAATCRRRQAISRSFRTTSLMIIGISSPTRARLPSCAKDSKATAVRSSIPAASASTAARYRRPWCETSAAARSTENRCARATSSDCPRAEGRQRARHARRQIPASRRDRTPR